MDIESAFAELGLTPGASEPEIKAAWRREVSRWHPDRNASAGAPQRMQRINQAFELIRTGVGNTVAASTEAAPTAASRPAASEGPRRVVQRKLRLSLEEAAFGCTRLLRGRLGAVCRDCSGQGHQVLGGHCPHCRGSGAVSSRAWFGWATAAVECEACHGGGIAMQTCSLCAGSGKAADSHYAVKVRLPHGVRSGDLLQVEALAQGPSPMRVELNIRIEVARHPLLQLDADGRLRCEVPVDGFAWIAQRRIMVPTLDGEQPLQLERDRLAYCLEGRGFPVERRGARADQQITIKPVFAPSFSADQQILLDQLIATSSGPDAPGLDPRLKAWRVAMRELETQRRRPR